MIIVFGNFFNQTIHLLNACIDPETAVTRTCVIVNFAVYIHILDIVLVPKTICADELTKQ